MSVYKIKFLPENVEVEAAAGENLIAVAAKASLHINASCGGEGVCGRCRVELKDGNVDSKSGPGAFLSDEEYAKGYRLACCCFVSADASIFIPLESRADASIYATSLNEAELTVHSLKPMVKITEVELSPPSADDNIADYDRLLNALAASGLEKVKINLELLRKLPEALRESNFKLGLTIFDDPLVEAESTVVDWINLSQGKDLYALAIDIGTTTVWGKLVNLATGESGASHGDLNGQISFGEDVISRIIFASKGDGAQQLQDRVIKNINKMIELVEADEAACRGRIALVVVSGNTTMSHLFTGVNSKQIRLSPYVPAAASWPTLKASDLNLNLNPVTPVLICPSVSSYVGGDIVAGVLASELYKNPELTLFIDVGTNGEIVVGNQDWMTCAACSAGPAFEGGGVKFGMRAAPGAIDQFYFDPVNKQHQYGVIGDEKPLGICGSGLINIVAELFMAGVIDQQGKYVASAAPDLIRSGEDGQEYLICPAAESAVERDIVLNELDIENLIRAKGAMYSGYQTLLESVGLTMGDIEKVIIGGGFGKSLNLKNAIYIGLLPELPAEKFTYIGNSSLFGAALAALSGDVWLKAAEIKNNMTNFELSETPGYMDYYMSSQFLPHTQSSLFPETMAKLGKK